MTGEFGASMDLVTGGLLAAAVEPQHGASHDEAHDDGAGGLCLNCGTCRVGDYCHACGQTGHVHRSFAAIGHELAHGVFHFEGKIWRTLPMLAFHPGALTRRYIHGERARFVSPMALFLFIIFVLFAMLSVAGAHLEAPEIGGERQKATVTQLERSLARNGEELAETAKARAAATDPTTIRRLDARLGEQRDEAKAMTVTLRMMKKSQEGANLLTDIHTGWPRLDKGLAKGAENPNLMLYKIQSNAYKFAWALIPLSLPFMWLLFPFSRRFKMYDHAVFVTYSLCFVTLLGMTLAILTQLSASTAIDTLLWTLAMIAIPLHIYKQLRGAYAIGRFATLVRTVALFVMSSLALVFFILLLLGLGLVG